MFLFYFKIVFVLNVKLKQKFILIYFGMFDGYAGLDVVFMIFRFFYKYIMERFQSRIEVIKYKFWFNDSENKTENGFGNEVDKFGSLGNILVDSIIVGVVEESFVVMVRQYNSYCKLGMVYCCGDIIVLLNRVLSLLIVLVNGDVYILNVLVEFIMIN